ncbi:GntR family transcriptional regulator [Chakrabartyella piscis]|uniref:GntR family transcriptional regulator n=1 Tax=Chakrabartyella piscis TaxID=2918914 RepID=UPI002958378D|nr:GntR family transcriptional regulator [Chakrabartyella piscis]
MAKTSLKLEAYNAIRKRIMDCTYAPGTILNEDALTEEFNVSRTPIRDAISRLEQEGIVIILPKKGVMVSELSISQLNSIFEIRILFEPYALERYGSSMDESKLFAFYEAFNNDMQLTAFQRYELDDEFHNFIMSAIPNTYMHRTYDLIQVQNIRYRVLTGNLLGNCYEVGHQEHLEILSHCLKKNWSEAAKAMEQHLLRSKNSSFDIILEKSLL